MGITTESSGSRKAKQKLFSQAGTIAVKTAQNAVLATIENNHYESGENHQKKSKRKSHYYNNSKGSTIVLANNAQKIGANE